MTTDPFSARDGDFSQIPGELVASSPGIDLAALIEAIEGFIRRFVVMTDAQLVAVTLWVAHTHAADAADLTAYLNVVSAEKRSGKSRLLEVVALLAHRPLRAAGVSEAALFRSLGADHPPTLLMDEVDAIFGPKATSSNEDLRALLNAGYQRGTPVLRCVGDGSRMRVEEFHVFGPKALAGIGELPDTIADRSLPIRLKRRARSEPIQRFRVRDAVAEATPLREQLATWAGLHLDRLRASRPEMPDELDDRAQDAVEPLLAIADLAGRDWPYRARQALIELRGSGDDEPDSLGVRLLADIKAVFVTQSVDRLSTAELREALAADDEGPWRSWRGDGPIPARSLANLLSRYEIRSRTIRLADGTTPKGYLRESFEDAWDRYVTSKRESCRHNATTGMDTTISGDFYPLHENGVESRKPASADGCGGVADETAKQGQRRVAAPGEDGFLDVLDGALAGGRITEGERRERRRLHFTLRGLGAATS